MPAADETPPEVQLSIGAFARRTRLTVKALRIHDENGLLAPASIDPGSGYRRYRLDQVRTGQLIAMLRGADLGLAEIGRLLTDLATVGPRQAVQRLDELLTELDRRHATRRMLIRHIQTTLAPAGDDPMFPIASRHVPSRRVMSIQRRLHAPETDGFVREAKAAFADHLGGAEPSGPFMLIFHGPVDAESDGPLEAVLGCADDTPASDTVGVRTEPAHDEAYATITKAQWSYPAILAAYDAVACSAQVAARPGSSLSCREVYVAEPDAIGDGELVCDIAYPLS